MDSRERSFIMMRVLLSVGLMLILGACSGSVFGGSESVLTESQVEEPEDEETALGSEAGMAVQGSLGLQ